MPPICSPIVRPGRPAEAAPVVSKQLSDTISRQVLFFPATLLGSIIFDAATSKLYQSHFTCLFSTKKIKKKEAEVKQNLRECFCFLTLRC